MKTLASSLQKEINGLKDTQKKMTDKIKGFDKKYSVVLDSIQGFRKNMKDQDTLMKDIMSFVSKQNNVAVGQDLQTILNSYNTVSNAGEVQLERLSEAVNGSTNLTGGSSSQVMMPTLIDNTQQQQQQQLQQQDANSMMPQMTKGPVTYLACLNDLVGTHKTTDKRSPIKGIHFNINPAAAAAAAECYNFTASALSATLNSNMTPNSRKRRVSMMDNQSNFGMISNPHLQMYNSSLNDLDGSNSIRRRFSSLNDTHKLQAPNMLIQRSHSISTPSAAYQDKSATANRKGSIAANSGQALAEFGAYWSEDVTDAAVWTIVGTGI